MADSGRLLRSLVLAVPLLSPLWGDGEPTSPKPKTGAKADTKRPSSSKPQAKSEAEAVEKRRDRMKQRDGEIDRLLKGKQRPKR